MKISNSVLQSIAAFLGCAGAAADVFDGGGGSELVPRKVPPNGAAAAAAAVDRERFRSCLASSPAELEAMGGVEGLLRFDYEVYVAPAASGDVGSVLSEFELGLADAVAASMGLGDCSSPAGGGSGGLGAEVRLARKFGDWPRNGAGAENPVVGVSTDPPDSRDEKATCSTDMALAALAVPWTCFPVAGAMTAWIADDNRQGRLRRGLDTGAREEQQSALLDAIRFYIEGEEASFLNDNLLYVAYVGPRDAGDSDGAVAVGGRTDLDAGGVVPDDSDRRFKQSSAKVPEELAKEAAKEAPEEPVREAAKVSKELANGAYTKEPASDAIGGDAEKAANVALEESARELSNKANDKSSSDEEHRRSLACWNRGSHEKAWHPQRNVDWSRGYCRYTVDCNSKGHESELACCQREYAGQTSGFCLMQLPAHPTSSPTTAGGLDVYYPDYATPWPDAYCINDRPLPNGRPTYSTMLECCKGAYKGQTSGKCLSMLPDPPTTSPTPEGGADFWYPRYEQPWANAGCSNSLPLPYNNVGDRPSFSTQLDCCRMVYAGQSSGMCLAELPQPPTAGPIGSGGLDYYYPDYETEWSRGTCKNDHPFPFGPGSRPTYSTMMACCMEAYAGQHSMACICSVEDAPSVCYTTKISTVVVSITLPGIVFPSNEEELRAIESYIKATIEAGLDDAQGIEILEVKLISIGGVPVQHRSLRVQKRGLAGYGAVVEITAATVVNNNSVKQTANPPPSFTEDTVQNAVTPDSEPTVQPTLAPSLTIIKTNCTWSERDRGCYHCISLYQSKRPACKFPAGTYYYTDEFYTNCTSGVDEEEVGGCYYPFVSGDRSNTNDITSCLLEYACSDAKNLTIAAVAGPPGKSDYWGGYSCVRAYSCLGATDLTIAGGYSCEGIASCHDTNDVTISGGHSCNYGAELDSGLLDGSCGNANTLKIVGGHSCNGEESCTGVEGLTIAGGHSCNGKSSCEEAKNVMISGGHSCNDKSSCRKADGLEIEGGYSCNDESSCSKTTHLKIKGGHSCTGQLSCHGAQDLNVGAYSCNSTSSCKESSGNIGNFACTEHLGCFGSAGDIPDNCESQGAECKNWWNARPVDSCINPGEQNKKSFEYSPFDCAKKCDDDDDCIGIQFNTSGHDADGKYDCTFLQPGDFQILGDGCTADDHIFLYIKNTTERPTVGPSYKPSSSSKPSFGPSPEPSSDPSEVPSTSVQPTLVPSTSGVPSTSVQPTLTIVYNNCTWSEAWSEDEELVGGCYYPYVSGDPSNMKDITSCAGRGSYYGAVGRSCNQANDLTIGGGYSCNGTDSCREANNLKIEGGHSCNGDLSCIEARNVVISKGHSCNGGTSCTQARNVMISGGNSCNDKWSCADADGLEIEGGYSCIGGLSSCGNTKNLKIKGGHSCNGTDSCYEAKDLNVGAYSCNSNYTCRAASGVIGNFACTKEMGCWDSTGLAIPDNCESWDAFNGGQCQNWWNNRQEGSCIDPGTVDETRKRLHSTPSDCAIECGDDCAGIQFYVSNQDPFGKSVCILLWANDTNNLDTNGCTADSVLLYVKPRVVCGATTGDCEGPPTKTAEKNEGHEVRCCSDTQKEGWEKNEGCDVWGESYLPNCHHRKTYDEAAKICADNGARLCSEKELLANCAEGSGCGHDHDHVWASTDL